MNIDNASSKPRYIYAANRKIGLACLRLLIEYDWLPEALLVPSPELDANIEEMKEAVSGIKVSHGKEFRSDIWKKEIMSMRLDYIISVHFPYIIPIEVIGLANIGALNIHPSFLPYNKGWHTPSWAIYDKTPYGVTLHWMDEGIDTGDIALRRVVEKRVEDTAHTLYQRALQTELELFKEAIPMLIERKLPRVAQEDIGTLHKKKDIQLIQKLELTDLKRVEEIIRTLRALTTDQISEAAYFEHDGKRYRIRVDIKEED